MSDMKLIMENWDQFMNEAELAGPIYDKLKAAGKLPAGATRKGSAPRHAGATSQSGGRTMQAKGGPQKGKPVAHFDSDTGAPLTAKGRELCAKNPQCREKHLKGEEGGAEGPNRMEMAKILGRNYIQLKRALDNVPDDAMMAADVKKEFQRFEGLFLSFVEQFRSGR